MKVYKLIFNILAISILTSCSYNSTDDLIPIQDNTDDGMMQELTTYDGDIKSIFDAACVSCHGSTNPNGGVSMTNYLEVRETVENGNTLDRIMRSPGDPLIMPQQGPLPQATIDMILQWQADGFPENDM